MTQASVGLCENMAHSFTIRKLLLMVVLLFLLRMTWQLLRGISSVDNLDQKSLESMKQFSAAGVKCNVADGKCYAETDSEMAPVTGKGLHTYKDKFYLDGKELRIIGGSFHYFRTQPEQWADRLRKMKAAGLNTVTTYIPWNVHEKVRLQYNFGGRYNLEKFIKEVHGLGLHMIIRAGPYICAEWELGGLPAWLLADDDINLRSSQSTKYMTYVEQYFSKLFPLLTPFTHKKGGPIIAFQIENEFGSWKKRDDKYMHFLLEQHKLYGLDELFITSDGSNFLQYGSLPGVLATVNFAKNPERHLNRLKEFQPNKPLMVTEFWSGWFDHWFEKHHTFSAQETASRVQTILGTFNASINFYMFTGGTNFGFYNGANGGELLANIGAKDGGLANFVGAGDTTLATSYEPTITSYDYDAPISENGDFTEKFNAIRDVIVSLNLTDFVPTHDAFPITRSGFKSEVSITQRLDFNALINISQKLYGKIVHDQPNFMEKLRIDNFGGQNYGWILYRAVFSTGNELEIKGDINDRAQIFINNKPVAIYTWKNHIKTLEIPPQYLDFHSNENIIEIFVENLGRINYRRHDAPSRLFENQKKGIQAEIFVNDQLISNWEHIPFDFEKHFRDAISLSKSWVELDKAAIKKNVPCAFKRILSLPLNSGPEDTYIDMSRWSKGIVLVNGFNLGRYWIVGPQKTLYVPAPLLVKGDNEIIVFELHEAKESILFTDKPLLG